MNPFEILIPFIWAIGIWGAGSFILRRSDSLCPICFFPAAGFTGLFVYCLGHLGLLHRTIFIFLTVVFGLLAIRLVFKARFLSRFAVFSKKWPLPMTIILIALLWLCLAALSFPVSTDALYFHLGIPKIFAETGRISFRPDILFSASPMTSEMITTAFYSLGLERGGQFFILLVAAMLALSIWKHADELKGKGGYALLILLTIPIFVSQLTGSKNDYLLWGLSFFSFLKFISFLRSGNSADIIWAGLGAGMAAGTKAIGLALYGPPAMLMLLNCLLGKIRFRHFLCFSIFFILLASPWYFYSWIVAGNPLFPFFDNIFHSPYTSNMFEAFNRKLAVPAVDRNLLSLIGSPFNLIFNPELHDGRLGYAIILFPLLLIFVRRIPSEIKSAIGIVVIFSLIWFLGFPYARFLLPVGCLLAVAGSFFISVAAGQRGFLKVLAVTSLSIGVLLPIPAVIRDSGQRVFSVIEDIPRHEYLRNFKTLDPYQTGSGRMTLSLPYIDCWEAINNGTQPDSRIGIMTSFWTRADGYYLERDFYYLNPSEQNLYDFTKLRDDFEIGEALQKLGMTHVVLDSVVLRQYDASSAWAKVAGFEIFQDGVIALERFCRERCRLLYTDVRFEVFEIISAKT